jgi:hypothetical protein
MTISEKIRAILTASPAPVPLVAGKVFAGTAPQSTLEPYLVFNCVSSGQFRTQDEQKAVLDANDLQRWRYQIKIISSQYLAGEVALRQAINALVSYTDRPANGLQRALELNTTWLWLETQRLNQWTADLDIMENLTQS